MIQFKKLLKVIALDWENCDKLTEDLKVYFQNQVVECGETAKQSARDYSNLRTQVSELEIMVKTRKKPVGVYLTQPPVSHLLYMMFSIKSPQNPLIFCSQG